MLKESEKQTLRKKLSEYEGTVYHMYLDSKGFVTIGVGHLLSTVAEAQKLSFVDSKTSKKATVDDIKADFENVSKQPKNKFSSYYKAHTKLVLNQIEIDNLTNSHIEIFYNELKLVYPEFDSYPEAARLALFDLIFNLGMTNLRTLWPTFNKAVKEKDWKKAGDASNRSPPISALRNKYVKDLLYDASSAATKK